MYHLKAILDRMKDIPKAKYGKLTSNHPEEGMF
jgi:hypothetical protein